MLRSFLALILIAAGISVQASVNATLDRKQGAVGAPLLLTLEAQQPAPSEPDLSVLETDFTILGRRHNTLSSFSNGRTLYTQRWLITLSPRRAGQLTLPAITLGNESSEAIIFKALEQASSPSGPALLESSIEQPIIYSRTATVLSVRLYYQAGLTHAEITEPLIDGVQIYPLGDQRYFREQRDGQRYSVIEQRYSLLPEQPGRYRIPTLQFNGLGGSGNPLSAESSPLEFEALPWPEAAAPAEVAATELRLDARWSNPPGAVRAGDTLTRTLIVEAHNVPAAWLPRPALQPPPNVRAYPQPEKRQESINNGVLVSRLELPYQLLFTAAGPAQFPVVTINWWDSVRERREQARLAAERIEVGQFLAPAAAETAVAAQPQAASRSEQQPAPPSADSVAGWSGWLWALVALVCAAGWTLSRAQVRQLEAALSKAQAGLQSETQNRDQADQQQRHELQALDQLQRSCLSGDAAAAYEDLLQWAGEYWPDEPVTSLADIERLASAPTLNYLLRNLEHSLRRRHDDEPWHGDLLYEQIVRLRERRQRSSASPQQRTASHVEV
nr:BatD family protein [Motiliproteus sediminis]